MSSKYRASQFVDPSGGVLEVLPNSNLMGFFSGVPTASIGGYLPGALAIDITNGQVYRNTGTINAATWLLIAGTSGANNLVNSGSALTVTQAAHDGRTIVMNTAGGSAITLPAMAGTGAKYRFVFGVTYTGNAVFTATGAHLFGGVVQNNDTGAAGLFGVSMATNAGGATTITLNGTTTGGRRGDWIEIEDVAASTGIVRGFLNASGTEATPFA